MAKSNKQPTRVEDVLRRIEAREQKKSRRRTVVIGLVAAGVIGAGVAGVRWVNRKPAPLPSFSYADLKADEVPALLNQHAILVSHPELGTDTVRSLADYETMTRLVELSRLMDEQQNQPTETDTTQARMAPFVVDVAGPREAGKPLTFTIENYQDEVVYMLDFGNGYRRKVDKRTIYRYPMPGNFEIKLLATKDELSSIYQKRFRIDPASQIAQAEPQTPAQPREGSVRAPANEPIIQDMLEAEPELFAASEAAPLPTTRRVASPPAAEATQASEETPAAAEPAVSEPIEAPAAAPAEGGSTSAAIDQPLIISEIEPMFPGGNSAMVRYIQRNYRYPSEARDRSIEGVVIVRFVVNPDGSLTDFQVVKGIGYGCDEEALRLISSMPGWVPGEQNGTKVPVYRTIPITFRLL